MKHTKTNLESGLHCVFVWIRFFVLALIVLQGAGKAAAAQPGESVIGFVNIKAVGFFSGSGVLQFAGNPFPNWSASLNSLVSSGGVNVELETEQSPRQKAGDVEDGCIFNKDLIQLGKHFWRLLGYLLVGFLGVVIICWRKE